jgi:hypothetical protein
VLAAVRALAGPVQINPRPQEVPWSTPLDQDEEHASYDPAHVSSYFAAATLSPAAARWDAGLGEFVLDWDDARASADPHRAALEFGRSSVRHACAVCGWGPALAASAQGEPPPIA